MTGKSEVYQLYHDKFYKMLFMKKKTINKFYLCSDFSDNHVEFNISFNRYLYTHSDEYINFNIKCELSEDSVLLMRKPRCPPIVSILEKQEEEGVIGYHCEYLINGKRIFKLNTGYLAIIKGNDEVLSKGKTMSGVLTGARKQICNRVLKKLK